jgi:hypothetical protein
MSTIQRVELDSTLCCPDAVEFETRMHDRVVGQNDAIEKLSWIVQTFMAGFSPVGRPVGVLLFLGRLGFRTQNIRKPWSPPPPTPLALSPIHCHRMRAIEGKRLETGGAEMRSGAKWKRDYCFSGLFLAMLISVRNSSIGSAELCGNHR